MTERDEESEAALERFPYCWAQGVDLNAGARIGFESGVAWVKERQANEKAAREKALDDVFKELGELTPKEFEEELKAHMPKREKPTVELKFENSQLGLENAKAQARIQELEAREARPACKNDPGATHYVGCECHEMARNARIVELEAREAAIRQVVDEQAEDEGLWSVPAYGTQPISEAYLQQELRKLHAVIEDSSAPSEMLERVKRLEAVAEAAKRITGPDEGRLLWCDWEALAKTRDALAAL